MIKFTATAPNGRRILGMGLSRGNVTKLLAGQPIHFNVEQMGLSRLSIDEVLIMGGETEDALRAELEANGYLEGTRVIEERTTKQ